MFENIELKLYPSPFQVKDKSNQNCYEMKIYSHPL